MFETYQICPYTGLRSFTEEESLYFKGREDDINRATEQLQRNKFLMLTGASGDGKSSLIYAGIIPNARSGFLKSKYSSWCVADFRPERSPFQNLCKSVARELAIDNPGTVQSELNHGFSALVDLYKNSKRFIDMHSLAWENADKATRATVSRQAANLIVLVDQFEEFFTNPENYKHGVPSNDSNLVLNILLETARIALEEELPIYVVFTMRSDYIGQCAAFRGLPEYIGFSQFFVPRLNRTQLQQAIEEPATLSGNRITRRLTERLIHDITEGTDQLPILQHALSQIWVAADAGKEEMDLLHYAMVGGMGFSELPDEQLSSFNQWFDRLSPELQSYYANPSLQNVLDTHTNKLYGEAANYYMAKTGNLISAENAKLIIRNAFCCLTKIDESRAVRNRMTLEEITNILGLPEFNTAAVGEVLNTFREPGNTFIRPFIFEENRQNQKLSPGQVLDITHESLIRNWRHLGQWAKEEFESYSVFIDFERQLNRWVHSGKNNDFLLSIGQLTYFENWYNKAKPNEWWIARYLPGDDDKLTKLAQARETLKNSREFLKKSARKHVVTRTIIHYGVKRIAIAAAIIALVTLSSFIAEDYLKKQNSSVIHSIHQESLVLAGNPKVDDGNESLLICEELKLNDISIEQILQSVKDTVQKINVLNSVAQQLVVQGKSEPKKYIFHCLATIDSLFSALPEPLNNPSLLSSELNLMNEFRVSLEFAYYYNADSLINQWRKRNADRSARWVLKIVNAQPSGFHDIENFNLALENAINYRSLSNNDMDRLLRILSPFENGLNTNWLQANFHIDKLYNVGFLTYGFQFNGLYQELAYLYAAKGSSQKVLQCIDTLLRYPQHNYNGDYASGADNAANIASVFFSSGNADKLDDFVSGYCLRKTITPEEFYARLIGRTLPDIENSANLNLFPWSKIAENLNVKFCSRQELSLFYNKYRQIVESTVKDADQKNLLLALSLKNEAIEKSLSVEKPDSKELSISQSFDQAFSFYQKVSPAYLNKPTHVTAHSGGDELTVPQKYLFIYPDLRLQFDPDEPRIFFYFTFSDVFLDYLLNKNMFNTLYSSPDELSAISGWLGDYNSKQFAFADFLGKTHRYETLSRLAEYLYKTPAAKNLDFNLLYLYLGLDAQQRGDSAAMLRYYQRIETKQLFNILQDNIFGGQLNDQSFRLIATAVAGLSKYRDYQLANEFVNMFKNPINRSSLYGYAAIVLQKEKVAGNIVSILIDSAKKQANLAEKITEGEPDKELLATALILQSPDQNAAEALRTIKNIAEKSVATRNMCKAYAFNGQLFNALEIIPPLISHSDIAFFDWYILNGYYEATKQETSEWSEYDANYFPRYHSVIRYINENN